MIGRRVEELGRIARFLDPAVSPPFLPIEERLAGMLVRHPLGVKVTGRGDTFGRDGNSGERAGSAPYE